MSDQEQTFGDDRDATEDPARKARANQEAPNPVADKEAETQAAGEKTLQEGDSDVEAGSGQTTSGLAQGPDPRGHVEDDES